MALAAAALACRSRGRDDASGGDLAEQRAALLAGSGPLVPDPAAAGEIPCPAPLVQIDEVGVTVEIGPSTALFMRGAPRSSEPTSRLQALVDGHDSDFCRWLPRRDGRIDEAALGTLLREIVAARPACPPPLDDAISKNESTRLLRLLARPPDHHVLIAPGDATPWHEVTAAAAVAKAAGLPDLRIVPAAAATFRTSCRPAPR